MGLYQCLPADQHSSLNFLQQLHMAWCSYGCTNLQVDSVSQFSFHLCSKEQRLWGSPQFKFKNFELIKKWKYNYQSGKSLSIAEEWMHLHKRLWHLPYSIIFWLTKVGFLPKKFFKLQHDRPYVSLVSSDKPANDHGNTSPPLMEKSQFWKWTSSTSQVRKLAWIRSFWHSKSLFPRTKGNLTLAWIWDATIFVDYFTKFFMSCPWLIKWPNLLWKPNIHSNKSLALMMSPSSITMQITGHFCWFSFPWWLCSQHKKVCPYVLSEPIIKMA